MIVLILLAFVGMLTGIFLILGMTPFTFAEELTKPLSGRRQPISKQIQQVNHPKEPKGIRKTVLEAREKMKLTLIACLHSITLIHLMMVAMTITLHVPFGHITYIFIAMTLY